MSIFGTKKGSPLYHVDEWNMRNVSTIDDLQRWADDPNCIEREQCAEVLKEKLSAMEKRRIEREQELSAKRSELQKNPFDPRTEVSADARHIADRIVKNLWIKSLQERLASLQA